MHQRHTQVEGPIQEYKRAAGDWTPEMQQALSQALATAKRRGPIILSMSYSCPECGESPTGIRTDSVLFYEDDDKDHMLNPVAEARLIVMEGCDHSFRHELSGAGRV